MLSMRDDDPAERLEEAHAYILESLNTMLRDARIDLDLYSRRRKHFKIALIVGTTLVAATNVLAASQVVGGTGVGLAAALLSVLLSGFANLDGYLDYGQKSADQRAVFFRALRVRNNLEINLLSEYVERDNSEENLKKGRKILQEAKDGYNAIVDFLEAGDRNDDDPDKKSKTGEGQGRQRADDAGGPQSDATATDPGGGPGGDPGGGPGGGPGGDHAPTGRQPAA